MDLAIAPISLGDGPRVVDVLPIDGVLDGETFVIRNYESRYLTHIFHKYAGKFTPAIPRWALSRYGSSSRQCVVLDPFVGSGTSMVESLVDGHSAYGIDVDPLARLITRVKTNILPDKTRSHLLKTVLERLVGQTDGNWIPSIPTLAHWFSPKAIDELSRILAVVESFREDPGIYDFLTICFSSVVRRASNADNQTMKTYVSHTHQKQPEEAILLFERNLHCYLDRLNKLAMVCKPGGAVRVIDETDACSLNASWIQLNGEPVDLVVTSPPYIKSVDYIYNQMVELFWIGQRWGLETQPKQNAFKARYIGNERPSTESLNIYRNQQGRTHQTLDQLASKNARLASIAYRYFSKMQQHFRATSEVMKPGAHYILVVGESTLDGVLVPTPEILLECAESCGFQCTLRFAYEIRNKHMRFPRGGRGGQISHDYLLDMIWHG